jgi:hypothetical protein
MRVVVPARGLKLGHDELSAGIGFGGHSQAQGRFLLRVNPSCLASKKILMRFCRTSVLKSRDWESRKQKCGNLKAEGSDQHTVADDKTRMSGLGTMAAQNGSVFGFWYM